MRNKAIGLEGSMRAVWSVLLCLSLIFESCSREGEERVIREEGAFQARGELAATGLGVRLSYGAPRTAVTRGTLAGDWKGPEVGQARREEVPGVHRVVLGEEFGEKGAVFYGVAERCDWQVLLPPAITEAAIEPGQPLTLQGYAPVKPGIAWRIERTDGGVRLYATTYSLMLRYGIDGKKLNRTVPYSSDTTVKELRVYYR